VTLALLTDPAVPDTDGDGVPDGGEVLVLGTDPTVDERGCLSWTEEVLPATHASRVHDLSVADLDGDGDLLGISFVGYAAWWHENLGATFGPQRFIDLASENANTIPVASAPRPSSQRSRCRGPSRPTSTGTATSTWRSRPPRTTA
jgi:hypothetical protein